MRHGVVPAAFGLAVLAGCSLLVAPEGELVGTGGAGGAQACATAEECPEATSECFGRTCEGGVCGIAALPEGTPLGAQVSGDCLRVECDGAGALRTAPNDLDTPIDGEACTGDVCTAGVPSNPPLDAGAPCGDGLQCDGAGQCGGCTTPDQCPGRDDDCKQRSCEGSVCGFDFTLAGTATTLQTAGDCVTAVCDGDGATTTEIDDTDIANDGNDCTSEGCNAGTPTSVDAMAGAVCDDAGIVCDGMGACVACNLPSQCGVSTACRTYSCSNNACGFANALAGAPCAFDGGIKCDGSGACVACLTGPDCASGVCDNNACVPATCADLTQNGDETDTDCGGSCAPCSLGDTCLVAGDCETGNCTTTCQPVIVVATSPASGAFNAPVGGPIAVTFSGPMSPPSLTAKTSLDAGACSGTIQLSSDGFVTCVPFAAPLASLSNGNTVATLVPSPGLSFGSTFAIRVTAAATDAQGAPITGAFTTPAGFTTRYGVFGADVVVSQVYGGGGNAGAVYTHDFVELHNRSVGPVSLAGWSVQYASPGGTTWSVTNLSGTIAPGGYYLVQLASGGAAGVALPAPDALGLSNLSAQSGKVALVSSTAALAGSCPAAGTIVDFVGYGSASCFEGAAPAPTLTVATAAWRPGVGCVDTTENDSDFVSLAPLPRTSASSAAPCPLGAPNESGVAYEADACLLVSPSTLTLATGSPSGAVIGEVTEAGLTEAAGQGVGVVAQVGFGPKAANPEHQAGWIWTAVGFDSQAGSADRFSGGFTAPAPGSYGLAYRVSVDGGATWTYCDTNGAGSNVGLSFETPRIGDLTVTN